MDLDSVPSRSPSVVTRKTGNEYVLVPVTNNIADMDSVYTLNETAAFIWDQVDGVISIKEIINRLTEEFDINEQIAKADTLDFISEMKDFLIIS